MKKTNNHDDDDYDDGEWIIAIIFYINTGVRKKLKFRFIVLIPPDSFSS